MNPVNPFSSSVVHRTFGTGTPGLPTVGGTAAGSVAAQRRHGSFFAKDLGIDLTANDQPIIPLLLDPAQL